MAMSQERFAEIVALSERHVDLLFEYRPDYDPSLGRQVFEKVVLAPALVRRLEEPQALQTLDDVHRSLGQAKLQEILSETVISRKGTARTLLTLAEYQAEQGTPEGETAAKENLIAAAKLTL